ncbi:AimR family lysis-lysogeny pheromone receptor [Bacillus cereus]|uniref:AimR family lysis-lysogeny pheromone receptor n=1 Tax=Bacillus cereus TaxID=1396 RepID=UPI003EE16514
MKYWLAKIIDEIDFQRKSQEDVAKHLGISGPAFSKNLSGKSELNFLNMIKLVKELYEDNVELTFMVREFCKKMNGKKNIRIAMEYANAIGDFELLRIAVQKGFNSNNTLTKEWAFVYEMVLIRLKRFLSDKSLLEELNERKKHRTVKSDEAKIMLDIITFYTLYESREYKMLFNYSEMLLPKIEKISDAFIRDLYRVRIQEIIAYASLMDEQIDKSRDICHKILNTEDNFGYLDMLKVSALGCLGESYSFDSYEQSLWYLNKGIELLNKCHSHRAVERKRNFLNMRSYIRLINKKDLYDLDIYDVGEVALKHIINGNEKEAVRLLRNVEKEKGKLTPMKLCYLGMALKDRSLLEQSIEGFINEGCKFYCRLPRKILEEFNKYGIIFMGDAK